MIFTVYDTAVAVTCIGAALTHMCTFSCIKPKSELPRHYFGGKSNLSKVCGHCDYIDSVKLN